MNPFILFKATLLLGSTSFAFAANGNPNSYSVEIKSETQAVIRDGTGAVVQTLVCQSGATADRKYKIICPKTRNRNTAFRALLLYDSSQNQWGSAPATSFLRLSGKPKMAMGCSAAGTVGPGNLPSFEAFDCRGE